MRTSYPLLCALFLALAACGPKASDTQKPDGVDEPGAPTTAANVEGPVRHYDAISKTAEAFTGALDISDVSPVGPNATPSIKISAATGLTYEANQVSTARGGDHVGIGMWASFMPIPEDADVVLYSVTNEHVDAKAPNGGLCGGGEKISFLATASYGEDDGAKMMQIAAFSDPSWPPKKTPKLCGTFTYQLQTPAAPAAPAKP